MTWFSIQHRQDTARVLVHGEIGTWGIGFDDFKQALGDTPKVDLHLDCPGGDSCVALQIAQLLQERDCTVTITTAISSGLTIAMGAKTIRAYSTARVMVHSPIAFSVGTPAELRYQADALAAVIRPIRALYRRRCSPDLVQRWFTAGDHWISPAEAFAVGLVDEVLEVPALRNITVDVQPGSDRTADPGQNEDESFVLDLLRVTSGLKVRSRERFGRELGAWFSTVKEL